MDQGGSNHAVNLAFGFMMPDFGYLKLKVLLYCTLHKSPDVRDR